MGKREEGGVHMMKEGEYWLVLLGLIGSTGEGGRDGMEGLLQWSLVFDGDIIVIVFSVSTVL